jgi:Fringe-like
VWRGVTDGGSGGGGGTWERIMHDVAIVVKTGAEVSEHRLRVLREKGWMSVGRRVPNLLVVGDKQAPGVVGMKRYGMELLLDEERHAREAGGGVGGGGAQAAPVVRNGTAAVETDSGALSGAGGVGAGTTVRDRPAKWFERSGWRGDKDKNLPAFHLLRTIFPGKKWYVMLDDDTYLFLDNFAALAARLETQAPAAAPLYTGKVFYVANCGTWTKSGEPRDGKGERAGFAHGGSGIVLNGAAMDAIYASTAACMHTFSPCWAGDMQVALCLRKHGVQPVRYGKKKSFERHFHPFSPSRSMADSRYTGRWHSTYSPISYHKVAESEVALVSAHERGARARGVPVVYLTLLKSLVDGGVRPTFSEEKTEYDTHVLDKEHKDFVGLTAAAPKTATGEPPGGGGRRR